MTTKPRVAKSVGAVVAWVVACGIVTTASLAQTPAPTTTPAPVTAPVQPSVPVATPAAAPTVTPAPTPAPAAEATLDPALCATYAASAVKDFADTALKPRCKRRENNRWHAVYDRHYNWCMTALIEPVRDEEKIRNGFLTRCTARAKAK